MPVPPNCKDKGNEFFNEDANELTPKLGNVDVFFMDPPYNNGLEQRALKAIKGSSVIDDDSIIIIEADIKLDTNLLSSFGFDIIKEKKYKTNKHIFLRRQS